jgi:uncharacterized protein
MTTTELTYEETIDAWRAQAEASLRADDSWLTLAGLFWLHEGENRFGSDMANEIVLPAPAPAVAGSFYLRDGQVTLEAAPGVALTVNAGPPSTGPLRSSAMGQPDLVALGDLTMLVHRSGARLAIRLRDRNSPVRQRFSGRRWFAVREEYCVTARFIPYDPPKILSITNIVGDSSDVPSPGYLAFVLDGQEYRLDATSTRDGLFIHFHDRTGGTETYPGGRFLKTAAPELGYVTLDFNQAVSPPCAFTEFATCPAVPPQNRLPVRIEAGERWQRA